MTFAPPELLAEHHDLAAFDSGSPALDTWLRTRALSNLRRGFSVVMVIQAEGRVVGYYGLAPTAVVPNTLPRAIRTGQPPDPVPCLLLGQLAIDRAWHGRGLGAALLQHALTRCIAAARLVGGRAVLVHALDDTAAAFWRRWGFIPAKDDPLRLFRAIADITASMPT